MNAGHQTSHSGLRESEAIIAKLVGCPPEWVTINRRIGSRISWDVCPPHIAAGVRIEIDGPANTAHALAAMVAKKCRDARVVLDKRGAFDGRRPEELLAWGWSGGEIDRAAAARIR